LSDNSELGFEGRYTYGFFTIDDTYFNDYEVTSNFNDGNTTYDVKSNKADLTNAAFVAYVSWTYQLSPTAF